jgi:hypothetical protein
VNVAKQNPGEETPNTCEIPTNLHPHLLAKDYTSLTPKYLNARKRMPCCKTEETIVN